MPQYDMTQLLLLFDINLFFLRIQVGQSLDRTNRSSELPWKFELSLFRISLR